MGSNSFKGFIVAKFINVPKLKGMQVGKKNHVGT